MSLVASAVMSEEKQENFCTYTSVKIDDEVLRRVKAAAGLDGKSVQDWLSDVANVAASKSLGKKALTRRPNKKGA